MSEADESTTICRYPSTTLASGVERKADPM